MDDEIPNLNKEQEDVELQQEEVKLTLWQRVVKWRDDSLYFKAIVLYIVIACDALCFTIIAPFLPEMIRDYFGIENGVGVWVGVVTGGFVMARFFSSTYIGHMSDKIGRKWLLTWSLFVSVIGTVCFGFMPTLFLAFLVRFLEGLVSATTVLSKTMIIDISNNENRAVLIGYISAAFSISKSLSSAIGGVVVAVEKKREAKNPFVAACILGGLILIIALVGALALPETRKTKKTQKAGEEAKKGLIAGIVTIYSDRMIRVLIIMFALQSFCNGSSGVIQVLLMEERIVNNGLGFSALEIGIYFTIFGVACFAFNLLFFKKLILRYGLYRVHTVGALFQTIQSIVFPLACIPYWISPNASVYWVYAIVGVQIATSTIGFMLLANTMQSMIVNVTDKSRQGLVQGTSQSVNNLARAFGPIITGALFTLSIRLMKATSAVFILSALLYAIAAGVGFISFRTQRDIDLLNGKISLDDETAESTEPSPEEQTAEDVGEEVNEDGVKVEMQETEINEELIPSSSEEAVLPKLVTTGSDV